jgi:hypothetical protein
MSAHEIKARLAEAQLALCDALDADEPERMPEIIASRETDLRGLVALFGEQPDLKEWASDYLERDRDILARAAAARDEVEERLSAVGRQKSVHRISGPVQQHHKPAEEAGAPELLQRDQLL